ncbi:ATP-binding protein [Endozoicomonas acroporae]|uniref:ATP-binding protein n=2 Tax=Endozoicomonas acroporae TaxID=1701104 RepID=UPI0019D65710|nr:ATP-binding protein [Endozoicomonas acroporae]
MKAAQDSLKTQAGFCCSWLEREKREICDYKIALEAFMAFGMPVTKASPDCIDDPIFLNHLSATGRIKVPHTDYPERFSHGPLAEQFANSIIHWLQLINTPYAERDSYSVTEDDASKQRLKPQKKSLGIFYPEDYQVHELPKLSKSKLYGMHSLPEYFDPEFKASFVAKGNKHTPSESLEAFFHGPTIADCATAMLACQYRAIETIIGTSKFNRIFGSPVSKFRIARWLYAGSNNTDPIDFNNPLYRLFDDLLYVKQPSLDPVKKLSESDINKGDILYILGVDSYRVKHKTGDYMGYNLICTGQNSSGRNLYLGFGPDSFVEPKTYDQIKRILIEGYNKPPSTETLRAIKRGETDYAQWVDHIVPDDHSIGGIKCALRFSLFRWECFTAHYDQAWHQQPLLPLPSAREPKPVDHGSPFPSENLVDDFEHFESASSQQDLMKQTALKFTHSVINNLNGTPDKKKPMGLFLTGQPGIGKTHLCVAVARKAAEYGVNTLYINEAKAGSLLQDFGGDLKRWYKNVDEILAGKDLVVFDDANRESGCTQLFLTKIMEHVMTGNNAIMVSSNHLIPVKNATPGFVDPLTETAHNFFYLSELQGRSYRSQWWHNPEVNSADALSRLGQYQGCKAAAVLTEQSVSMDDVAKKLSIPVCQIRRVGRYHLSGSRCFSPDYYFSDLSKARHQAVFMECSIKGDESHYCRNKIEQFLHVVQRVHNEGLKLVVKTDKRLLFLKDVQKFLDENIWGQENTPGIIDRLKHMFPDFITTRSI